MELLLIVRCDPFKSSSGTEIFVGNLALELANQGHNVKIVYELLDSSTECTKNTSGIETYAFQLTRIPYLRAFHYRRKCVEVCINILKKSNVDAIICFGAGTFAGKLFSNLKGLVKKPLFVYYAVDSIVAEYERIKPVLEQRGLTQKFKSWIWYKALIRSDSLSCNFADIVLASCQDTGKRVSEDYSVNFDKIKLVYFGIPDDFIDGFTIYESEIPTFLHVSTVPERKGTVFFLKALKLLQDKYNVCARGIIAGSKESYYVNLAKQLNVDVSFLGRVPNEELKQYYASCTALVSPSLSEGFCLPVVEAAMFGKPSIVSETGSLPELVTDGENGFVVPICDFLSLAKKMYEVVIDDVLKKHLSDSSKTFSQQFKISSTTKTLIDALFHKCD